MCIRYRFFALDSLNIKKKIGIKVNSFDELLRKFSEISVKIKSNNLDIPEIVIGNQSIAEEIYEYIN